jgi:hypothetical protein
MNRVFRVVAVASVVMATSTVLIATPAEADLGSCNGTLGDNYFDAYCSGSQPTAYRAVVNCTDGHAHYGSWEWAGGLRSKAWCSTNTFAVSGSYQFSGV